MIKHIFNRISIYCVCGVFGFGIHNIIKDMPVSLMWAVSILCFCCLINIMWNYTKAINIETER